MVSARISLLFASVIALCLFVDEGQTFSCFQCNSQENKNCAIDEPSVVFQVNCGKTSDGIEITSCRKIFQYSIVPEQASRIIRECGILGEGRYANTCYQRPGREGFKEEVCACDTSELCNESTHPEVFVVLIMSLFTLLTILNLNI